MTAGCNLLMGHFKLTWDGFIPEHWTARSVPRLMPSIASLYGLPFLAVYCMLLLQQGLFCLQASQYQLWVFLCSLTDGLANKVAWCLFNQANFGPGVFGVTT